MSKIEKDKEKVVKKVKVKTKAKTKAKAKTKPKAKAKAKPKAKTKTKAKVKPKTKTKTKSKVKPKPKSKPKSSKKEGEEKIVSKHKQSEKHSLQYDTIFKGKKEEVSEETDTSTTYHNDTFNYDPSSAYHQESVNNQDYIRERELKERVYAVLIEHTEINFMNNRRKPSKTDFNEYYFLLKTHLSEDNFTNTEMFIELAYYFSDNLFNMFKLLETKWRNIVIDELQEHIGKRPGNSKDVAAKNLSIDAEIEFYTTDSVTKEEIVVTGIIKEQYHDEGIYIVDSYENIHEVHIDNIIKILNNTKFKYNLNKLNNIDFL